MLLFASKNLRNHRRSLLKETKLCSGNEESTEKLWLSGNILTVREAVLDFVWKNVKNPKTIADLSLVCTHSFNLITHNIYIYLTQVLWFISKKIFYH